MRFQKIGCPERFANRCASAVAIRLATRSEAELIVDEESLERIDGDSCPDLLVLGVQDSYGRLPAAVRRLLRRARCPTLIARAHGERGTFRSALCAVNFSECSAHAVKIATEVLERGGRLTLIHVTEDSLMASRARERLAHDEALAFLQLAEWAAALRDHTKLEVDSISKVGRAGAELRRVLGASPYDLVVMGAYHSHKHRPLMFGSLAERITRQSSCAMLFACPNGSEHHQRADSEWDVPMPGPMMGATPSWARTVSMSK
jgi:nucleotide-binding universal stress UspA family protein